MFTRCDRRLFATILLLTFFVVGEHLRANTRAVARNNSVRTLCAEHDNVNVPLLPPGGLESVISFDIEARHPTYQFDRDWGEEDFTNCPPPTHQDTFYESPGNFSIYDDGRTAVIAIRNDRWWRPQGMTAIGTSRVDDAHYIAVHRKLGEGDYPQVLVFYQDGNLRLKPFPPEERSDTLFGSSVLVGPAPVSDRPFVNVGSIEYRPRSDSFEIIYRNGGSAILSFEEVSREATRVRVEPDYPASEDVAFATFRSMYVRRNNTDVDHVLWRGVEGLPHEDAIMDFSTGMAEEFFFTRTEISRHNISAPDTWFGRFRFAARNPEFRRGDCNGDGGVDISDTVFNLFALFLGQGDPGCDDACDSNDDGMVDISDASATLAVLFLGQGTIAAPGMQDCGVDATDDQVSCEQYEACSVAAD